MSDVLGTIERVIDVLDEINARQSCVIRVTNNTDQVLRFITGEDNHSSGDFATLPAEEITPGTEDVFASSDRRGSVLTGCVGFARYRIGDTGAIWTVDWNNSAVSFDGNDANSSVTPPMPGFESTHRIAGGSDKVDTRFSLRSPGGGGGGGGGDRPPTPTPATDRQATALITIHNQSEALLTLVDQGHDHGAFMTFPELRIEPGGQTTFASVETEGSQQEGSQGFVTFNAGDLGACTWTVRWNNPEGADNTTTFELIGPDAPQFQAVDQVGQGDENVPVVFTLFGGRGGGGGVDPPVDPPIDPPVDPPDDRDFVEPVEQDEPTLRFGDKSVDGWVEYLQQLLNGWGLNVAVDGDFGQGTLAAVHNFQQAKGLMNDGVVGNETWSALREEERRPPSTDGRQPHTFVEGGQEARWFTEDNGVQYDSGRDQLLLIAHSTGTDPIASGGATAHIRVSSPQRGEVGFDVPCQAESTGQGGRLLFVVDGLRESNGADTYTVQGWLPQDLGGDHTSREITVS